MDVRVSLEDSVEDAHVVLPGGTLAAQYMNLLVPAAECNDDFGSIKVIKEIDCTEDFFITVLMRTQGNRCEEMREAFLCLSGQSDRSFEVFVIGHNIEQNSQECVSSLINEQPDWLRNRIRFLAVSGGSRSRPLNVGFSLARTEYVSILDDDDIVFNNWIESFHRPLDNHFGAIFHCGVFTQVWKRLEDDSGALILRAAGSPLPDYCSDYNPISQLSINMCPTMGLAFPTFVFQRCGLRFDESLTTTEDWDYLMRASFVCGVYDTHEPVAIYRLWDDADNSHSVHSATEWEHNRVAIQDEFAKMPILFPRGISEKLIAHTEGVSQPLRAQASQTKLYYDNGVGFSETALASLVSFRYDVESCTNVLRFEIHPNVGPIKAFRFDPCDEGLVTLENLRFEVEDDSGNHSSFSFYDIHGNGLFLEKTIICFIRKDPQAVIFLTRSSMISSVEVAYKFVHSVPDDLLTGTKLVVRFKEMIRRVVYRLKGRL